MSEEERIEQNKIILEKQKSQKAELSKIKDVFYNLCNEANKQKRGYDIEKIFFDLLHLEEFEYTRPYKKTGEQIDGHFRYEKFDYLVEIKWTAEVCGQSDLAIFDTKIGGKAQSTRGFLISINGFDGNSISRFSGHSPRLVLMDGADFVAVLEDRISFFDILKYKIDQFVRKGLIYVKYNNN